MNTGDLFRQFVRATGWPHNRKGKLDLHTQRAAVWFNIEPCQVTEAQRNEIKCLFHGWNYSSPRLFSSCPKPFEELRPVPRYTGMFQERTDNLVTNTWKKETPMRHSRDDYIKTAHEKYADDPNITPLAAGDYSKGWLVSVNVFISDEEVERRKGPFSAASAHDGAIVMRRDLERSYVLNTYARVEFPNFGPDYAEVRLEQARKIADALNAQWRAEKES